MFDSLFTGIDEKVVKLKKANKLPMWKVYLPLVLGLVLVFGSPFLKNSSIQLFVAGLGGLLLFIGGYLVWLVALSENFAELLAVRQRYNVFYRRRVLIVAFLVWVLLLVVVSRFVPPSILGGLSVFVILTIMHVFTPTTDEREETERVEIEIYEKKLEEVIERKDKRSSFTSKGSKDAKKRYEEDEWGEEDENVDDMWEGDYYEEGDEYYDEDWSSR